ncbi:MAG: glycine/betaine ABC transporter substrate-binding protein [Actinobacteria bacterium]|nr:glycine/betaine ABC transporter substrate-binding protein [Actinomycetota bacterium]
MISRRKLGLLAIAVASAAALAVAAGALGGASAASCGDVVLNENSWVGSSANVYVLKVVLEEKLDCNVKVANITENQPSFQAMADGKIDVVLEDWDNTLTPSNQRYVKNGSVVNVGGNGITGVIGWYIPRYLLKQYPQFKTWKGLKGKESVFKSPESGSQGMFLGGDPSYVQKDRKLIEGLGLDLKHVVAGAEPAQVARWSTLYKQKKPVLFYWYDPQYLNAQYDLVRVTLPKRFNGCNDDEKTNAAAKTYACEYPSYGLDKLVSGEFSKSGSPALAVVKRFSWSAADQNTVANMIAGKKMKPQDAAEAWVKANAAKVAAWTK